MDTYINPKRLEGFIRAFDYALQASGRLSNVRSPNFNTSDGVPTSSPRATCMASGFVPVEQQQSPLRYRLGWLRKLIISRDDKRLRKYNEAYIKSLH